MTKYGFTQQELIDGEQYIHSLLYLKKHNFLELIRLLIDYFNDSKILFKAYGAKDSLDYLMSLFKKNEIVYFKGQEDKVIQWRTPEFIAEIKDIGVFYGIYDVWDNFFTEGRCIVFANCFDKVKEILLARAYKDFFDF